jgi:palmitoyltransferase
VRPGHVHHTPAPRPLGNSVGELNHGAFWRLLALQLASIWLGKGLIDHAYHHGAAGSAQNLVNLPLLLLDALAWASGVPLAVLLAMHSFMALTSSTTHEFLKLDKLRYLRGFYECSCPFSEGLLPNLRRFCCPRRPPPLWERPPPEREWPETIWRNRYYSCFG